MSANPRHCSLTDQLLVEMRKKWTHFKFIFKHRVVAETRLDTNKNHRYISLMKMVSDSDGIGGHLFSPTLATSRKNNVEECLERTPIDTELYMRLFGDVDVFGPTQAASRECVADSGLVERAPGDFLNLSEVETLSDTICEVVNLRGMEECASTGNDRRKEQLSQYIDSVKQYGVERGDFEGVFSLCQHYRHKLGVGRAYCSWLSLHQCSRECRPRALSGLPWRVYELDQVNCQPSLLFKCIRDNFPSCSTNFQILAKYCENHDKWKKAIADYYGRTLSDAKNVLIRILYGAHYATGVSPDVLICLKGLYVEVRKAVDQLKQDSSFTSMLQLRSVLSAERPEFPALSIFLGGVGYSCTSVLKKSLEER